MARACGHQLADGTKCQIETEESHCELHLMKVHRKEVSHPKLIRDFVLSVAGDSIDLTGFHFKTTFDTAIFPENKTVVFDDSTFSDCQFWNIELQCSLSFVGCVFNGTTFENLSTSSIGGRCEKLDFSSARFRGDKVPFIFCGLRAQETVSFESATFESKEAPFKECYAQADLITFADALIESDRFYVRITEREVEMRDHRYFSLDSPNMNFARLKCNGHFEYGNYEEAWNVSPSCDFEDTDFRQMRTATFRRANLKRATFLGSQVEDVVFADPIWPKTNGRTSVYVNKSESEHDTAKLNRLLELFIALKKNYEASGNLIEAGVWHYQEMDCRQRYLAIKGTDKSFRWLRLHVLAFLPWYRRISEYGENYTRPLWFIAGVMAAFALIYFYWTGYPTDSGSINYEFAFELNDGAVGDFLGAMGFSAGVMLLQFVKLAAEQPPPTPQLAIIQVLLTLILVPLFLLALRRKFRR